MRGFKSDMRIVCEGEKEGRGGEIKTEDNERV